MNKRLQKAMEKIYVKYTPAFLYDGDFTVCLLWDFDVENIKSFGVAKRNPAADEYDKDLGEGISLARAVKKIMKAKKKAKK